MPEQFSTSLPYILLATGAGILGSVVALFWSPGKHLRNVVQHFAAGGGPAGAKAA